MALEVDSSRTAAASARSMRRSVQRRLTLGRAGEEEEEVDGRGEEEVAAVDVEEVEEGHAVGWGHPGGADGGREDGR